MASTSPSKPVGIDEDFYVSVNIVWNQQLGGKSEDYAYGTAVDSFGNVYVAGYTYGSFEGLANKGYHDAFIAKLIPLSVQ